MKIIYVHCSEKMNIRDPRSYKHYRTPLQETASTVFKTNVSANEICFCPWLD